MRIDNLPVVVVDDFHRENLYPLTLTKPSFDLRIGASTLKGRIEDAFNQRAALIVPEYLEDVARETHPSNKVNSTIEERCVVLNAMTYEASIVRKSLEKLGKLDTVLIDGAGTPIAYMTDRFEPEIGFRIFENPNRRYAKSIISEKLSVSYPWELTALNGRAISEFKEKARAMHRTRNLIDLGKRSIISSSAEIEPNVVFDSREGPIIIDDNAAIQSFSYVKGPAYVGPKSVVRSAKIREGTTIGEDCRVAGEIEESIISDFANKNHDGFLGHSYVGSWVNMGALTTNSDLKNTYGTIHTSIRGSDFDTKSIKVGVFMGDLCKTAVGTLIYSGRTIGVSTHLFGTVTEDVPSFTMFAKSLGPAPMEMYCDSAIETQRRMMKRRKQSMTSAWEKLIRSVFKLTQKDRKAVNVRKGKFVL